MAVIGHQLDILAGLHSVLTSVNIGKPRRFATNGVMLPVRGCSLHISRWEVLRVCHDPFQCAFHEVEPEGSTLQKRIFSNVTPGP